MGVGQTAAPDDVHVILPWISGWIGEFALIQSEVIWSRKSYVVIRLE